MKGLFLAIMLFFSLLGTAQQIRFSNNDDFIKVVKSDVVEIAADTAFVVSTTRAGFINNKLDELNELKAIYKNLSDSRNALFGELKDTEKALSRLAEVLESNNVEASASLEDLVIELDVTLGEFKSNNEALKDNNKVLAMKIEQLQKVVKQLKKETKHIWWNGMADKIVAFAGGALVGAVVVAILI